MNVIKNCENYNEKTHEENRKTSPGVDERSEKSCNKKRLQTRILKK